MKTAVMISLLALAGCAITPEKMATRSDFDVCRFTLSSMQGVVATAEARSRALDCAPFYPAIAAQQQANMAAALIMLNAAQQMTYRPPIYVPPQINCTSQRFGDRVNTTCN